LRFPLIEVSKMPVKENKIKVEIFGGNYLLKGEDDVEYMQKIASYVDKKMREIQESTGLISPLKIAILAALNIADELYKSSSTRKGISGAETVAAKKAFELIEKIEKELK